MRARDPRAAARTALPIIAVCAAVMAAFTTFGPNSVSVTTRAASWGTVALLVALGGVLLLVPAERLDRAGVFPALGVLGVVLVCAMNVVTDDPSAAAQAFLSFPVLWIAAHLRRAAVALVTTTAVLLDAAVLLVLLPVEPALTDLVFFGSVLVVISLMLVRAGDVQERLVSALHRQANVDSLTGLVNRRVLDEALAGALSAPLHPRGTALVLVDVDSFKAINDQHGHPVGDDALVHVAGVLRSVVRAGDAVLSRMGGDELAVLLPDCPPDVAARRAVEVLDAVRATPVRLPDGSLLALSVSLGVAHAPLHATGLAELYAAADAALYAAKRGGRGRVEVAGSR
ncbi:GGDEF domain-containing protein [Modestobacter roseus]|uniref:Diguanylate cyclase (GGDEF)-like protein n=1 Tax=Modestobacter roseus TaxID=1181884 RepID=A0A562IXK0_9ACTN|nr:GGDEF domain-containing protein [Modestobacter roseus]TWH75294.1 diguanylate cyclase (GGDEF)-like protein [Modestobacter roseus]